MSALVASDYLQALWSPGNTPPQHTQDLTATGPEDEAEPRDCGRSRKKGKSKGRTRSLTRTVVSEGGSLAPKEAHSEEEVARVGRAPRHRSVSRVRGKAKGKAKADESDWIGTEGVGDEIGSVRRYYDFLMS
jgi:hypothetical protein